MRGHERAPDVPAFQLSPGPSRFRSISSTGVPFRRSPRSLRRNVDRVFRRRLNREGSLRPTETRPKSEPLETLPRLDRPLCRDTLGKREQDGAVSRHERRRHRREHPRGPGRELPVCFRPRFPRRTRSGHSRRPKLTTGPRRRSEIGDHRPPDLCRVRVRDRRVELRTGEARPNAVETTHATPPNRDTRDWGGTENLGKTGV